MLDFIQLYLNEYVFIQASVACKTLKNWPRTISPDMLTAAGRADKHGFPACTALAQLLVVLYSPTLMFLLLSVGFGQTALIEVSATKRVHIFVHTGPTAAVLLSLQILVPSLRAGAVLLFLKRGVLSFCLDC